ncbi:MAG: 50S ribosomal protein L29 [Desulfobacterales bacterium]|mgnify:FL=1|jgi:large subunit ribosomal protein L29
MKAGEIRDMNIDEMEQKLSDLKEELFNLSFQHEIGQLENPQRMKETKRDIARVKTIIREVEVKNRTAEE